MAQLPLSGRVFADSREDAVYRRINHGAAVGIFRVLKCWMLIRRCRAVELHKPIRKPTGSEQESVIKMLS